MVQCNISQIQGINHVNVYAFNSILMIVSIMMYVLEINNSWHIINNFLTMQNSALP